MKYRIIIYSLLCMCLSVSCKKYLDAKPDKSLVVASQVSDYQALLDNNGIMNRASPSAGEGSADNYYLDYDNWLLYTMKLLKTFIYGEMKSHSIFSPMTGDRLTIKYIFAIQ